MFVWDKIRDMVEFEKEQEIEKFGFSDPPRRYKIRKLIPFLLSLLSMVVFVVIIGLHAGLRTAIIAAASFVVIFVIIPLCFSWLGKWML